MDIVERLRICAKFDPDQAEAADEIERLRGVIAARDRMLAAAYCQIDALRDALREIADDDEDYCYRGHEYREMARAALGEEK